MPTSSNQSSELLHGYAIEKRDPSKLSSELATLLRLLKDGGAVDVVSAELEIPHATALYVLLHEGAVVGLGTIKQEREWYAERVQSAEKSHHPFNVKMLELGYVVVADEHGGKHLSGHIADAILADYRAATCSQPRTVPKMKSTLKNRGFVQKGKEWDGERDPLSLWLRSRS